MFDIGFSEIVVIGVIALIVFGPEELPRVARLAGKMLGNFRHYVDQVKSELDQEIQASELKELGQEIKDSAQTLRSSFSEQMQAVESEVKSAGREMASVAEDVASPVRDAVAETGQVLKGAAVPAIASGQQEPETETTDREIAVPIEEATSPADTVVAGSAVPEETSEGIGKPEAAVEKDDNQMDLFGLSSGPSAVPHKS